MQKLLFCICMCFTGFALGADEMESSDMFEKKAVGDDLSVFVAYNMGGKIRSAETAMSYGFRTTMKSNINVLDPMNEMFFCRFTLWDRTGKLLSKTRLGEKYGKRFDEVKPRYEIKKTPATREMLLRITEAMPKGNPTAYYPLPPPDELFEILKAGTYRFRIEFQTFRDALDAKGHYLKLVRFPVIEYEITKEGSAGVSDKVPTTTRP